MQVNSVSSVSFNGKFSSVKKVSLVPLDGQDRKVYETTYYKKGLSYIWGQIKNFVNFLRKKNDVPNAAILSQKVVIPDYRVVDKHGFIDVVPTTVLGEFNMKNGDNVQYVSPRKGITYVSITNSKKPNIDMVLRGGERQAITSAEIKHYLALTQGIMDEINSGSGKVERETDELITQLWSTKTKKN